MNPTVAAAFSRIVVSACICLMDSAVKAMLSANSRSGNLFSSFRSIASFALCINGIYHYEVDSK